MFELLTPRLRLREATLHDAGFVLQLVNEPGWQRHINNPGVGTRREAQGWIETRLLKSYRESGVGFWLLERRGDGELLGLCGLFRRPVLDGPDLGYALLGAHEGQGFAREAAAACVAYAQCQLKWPELLAITAPQNPRSEVLLRHLGFADEGLRRLEGYEQDSRLWRLALR